MSVRSAWLAALLATTAACSRSGLPEPSPQASPSTSDAASPSSCPRTPEDGSPCALATVPFGADLPPGTFTVCPRKAALFPANDALGAVVIKARSTFTTEDFDGLGISFADPPVKLDNQVSTLLVFHFPTPVTVPILPQPYSKGWEPTPPTGIAFATWIGGPSPAAQGSGVVNIDSADLDVGGLVRGSIDVVFPDGCRLLADFVTRVDLAT